MKRAFTIFLLCLFLLNVLGYYAVLLGLRMYNVKEMEARFDADSYSEQEEIIINIPITVPYASDQTEFTRTNGDFEYQGEVYRMVKQRYYKDVIQVVCVKDNRAKAINNVLDDYAKTFSDKPVSEKSNVKTLPTFIKDFISLSINLQHHVEGWDSTIYFSHSDFSLVSHKIDFVNPPPRG